MGVYIEKMKRPEGCYCCPFAEGSWGYSPPNRKWCLVNGKDMPIDERNVQQNQHQCPLTEIPPHGRLIDADAFTKDECNNCDGACETLPCDCLNCKADCRCDFMKDIADAPTIIPAEEDE